MRAAAPLISQIKVIAPRVALEVIDQAVQMHGGAGVSQDFPLARMWTNVRTLRLADGPDAVHRRVISKAELKRYVNEARRDERGGVSRGRDRARRLGERARDGLSRPERGAQIPDRPIEPDLSHRDAGGALRAAAQAAGQAAEIGAYGRARVSRAASRWRRSGFPAPRALALCEDEGVVGSVFYLMAHVDGRIFWDPAMPELDARGARAASTTR